MTSTRKIVADQPASGDRHPPLNFETGVVEATLPLGEDGRAYFKWPGHLSEDSYEDLEAWVELVLRRARSSVPHREIREDERVILRALEYSDDDITTLTFLQARRILNLNIRKLKSQ